LDFEDDFRHISKIAGRHWVDSTIADMYYIQLPTGGPTQGDIWSNLPSGAGANQLCNGLVITPRCDFAHSKSPVLNYLPIVSLEQHLLSVACFPHIERTLGETRESLRSAVSALSLEGLFDLGVPIEEIRNEAALLRAALSQPRSKQIEKADADFEAGCKKMKEMAALLEKPQLTFSQLQAALNKKRISAIQRDLIKNNNADTYFLPPCSGLLESPSLVLLRHIYTCPINTVDLPRDKKAESSRSPNSQPERLLRLASPFIESLMSKFAALFTRVGTRDIPDPIVQAFIQLQDTART
jgi:hypothetical protein